MHILALAPAKINLGLEILGRRPDGYHDIATVFQSISLFDRIKVESASTDSVELGGGTIAAGTNLIGRALEICRKSESGWRVSVVKRIPMAAGLGGASSDAAATLLAVSTPNLLRSLKEMALQLGSDVPFFLMGGAALAHGRGELLEPLPPLRRQWIVIYVPRLTLESKTAALYDRVTVSDFTDGSRAANVARALNGGMNPHPNDLSNVFAPKIVALAPELKNLPRTFEACGAPFAALSGAGPAHYTLVPTLTDAISIASRLSSQRELVGTIQIARPMGAVKLVCQVDTDAGS